MIHGIKETIQLGDCRLEIEIGKIARQADAAVIVRQGDTMVLTTVVSSRNSSSHNDFLPLTVDFRELYGAAGIIPHAYGKREGRQSDKEVLSSRIVDRSIRPLFPECFFCETQIISTLLSCDPEIDGDVLGLAGACLALAISDIPWMGPAGGIRIARTSGAYHINPTVSCRQGAELEMVVAAGPEGLTMVEGHAKEVPDDEIADALEAAQSYINPLLELSARLSKTIGVPKREIIVISSEMFNLKVKEKIMDQLQQALDMKNKLARNRSIQTLKCNLLTSLELEDPDNIDAYSRAFDDVKYEIVRSRIKSGNRLDGRKSDQIRDISGESGWLPKPHGSALFTRGETQACVTCTLGPLDDALRIETTQGEQTHSFFLHYSFPPYSVGETKPMRGPGRREIGHGHLAWKALAGVVPSTEVFPYAIRLFSEITESNGSSSMASVCGGTIALMDCGVPIRKPVAGIAMGLIWDASNPIILSDIMGDEDHLGDMDFKVAGTSSGVTAIQMDNKIGKLPGHLLRLALDQAKTGRLHILRKIHEICPEIRKTLKPNAPRVLQLSIPPDRIREIIGPGGKVIQEMQRANQTKIDISDSGNIRIYASSETQAEATLRSIRSIVREPKIGSCYHAKVVSTKPFGVFVEIFSGTEGLVHVSELSLRNQDPMAEYRAGDAIDVKITGVDERGRIRLSQKQAAGASGCDFDET